MDPNWVRARMAFIRNEEQSKRLNPMDAKRMIQGLLSDYEDMTGETLADSRRRDIPALERLASESLMDQSSHELDQIEAALKTAVMADFQKKKRWMELISRTREVQEVAKSSAIAMWVYVGRDQEANSIFQMGDVHRKFFEVWNGPDACNLIMAPPGHAKSSSLRGQILWWIAQDPTQRILVAYDDKEKGTKEGPVIKQYIRSKRFQALFPGIRIVNRVNGTRIRESNIQFSVSRENISREPTIELAGICGMVNGNGYDRVILDDPCPPQSANQANIREQVVFNFENVIEKRLRNPSKSHIHLICTPWHQDDLAGHIQKQVREGRRTGWRIAVDEFRIEDDANGQPISIWPQRFSPAYYASERHKMRRGDYDRLYRLICTPDEEKIVKAVTYYPSLVNDPVFARMNVELKSAYLDRMEVIRKSEQWLSIDPSATAGRSSTETAVTQIALTMAGQAYVVDAWFFPGNPVQMQDWIVDKIKSGGIHHILFEAQGGMAGTVALWREYISKRLREEAFRWTGSMHECKTRHGTGQNIGKRQRLTNVAAYIEKGYLKFPGALQYHENFKNFHFVAGPNEKVRKLVQQLLNFPSGANDGVDTISQFLHENESRILRETVTVRNPNAKPKNQFSDGMAASLRGLREAATETEDGDMGKESKWIAERF